MGKANYSLAAVTFYAARSFFSFFNSTKQSKHIDFYWFPPFCNLLEVETAKYAMTARWILDIQMTVHFFGSDPWDLQGHLSYRWYSSFLPLKAVSYNQFKANFLLANRKPARIWLLTSHYISTAHPAVLSVSSLHRSHQKPAIKHNWEWAESGPLRGKLIYLYSVSAGLGALFFFSRTL